MDLYDVIIIGAGPAGMTAAIYTTRAGLKTLMLEAVFPGGKMANTAEIENWPGLKSVSGADLSTQMYEHCTQFGVDLRFAAVTGITDGGAVKTVHCGNDHDEAKAVIIASGTRERKLGIPGEDTYNAKGISYCAVCDGAFYRDQPVVVIGGGNSAYEDADYLSRFTDQVTLVLRRDVPRAEKILVDAVNRNPRITVRYNLTPIAFLGNSERITGVRFKDSQGDTETEIPCSGVFPMVGLTANTEYLKELPILNGEGFIETAVDMSTALPGIYAAGDVRNTVLRQIVTAAGDASIAAQSVVKHLTAQEA